MRASAPRRVMWLTLLVTGLAFAPALPSVALAATKTRSCGSTSPGYPAEVRASQNVPCSQARRIIDEVIKGSPQCYSGPGRFHPCTLEGFSCTAQFRPGDWSRARCVDSNRLILGRTD